MKNRTITLLLSCGIMGIYGFINSRAAFYNIIKLAFGFSDIQLGNIWSVYGIVSLASYLLGGYFADRIPVKKLVIFALSLAAVLHLYLSFVPEYTQMLVIAALLSIASVFTFFPASSKLLSSMGGEHSSGGVCGVYYALEGVWNTILNLMGTAIYRQTQDAGYTFVWMMRAYVVIDLAVAVSLLFLLPDSVVHSEKGGISPADLAAALKKREVWLLAVITMCTYTLFCSFTYIAPYLTQIYGIREEANLLFGIIRVDVMSVAAGVIFGKWADRRKSVVSVIKYGLEISMACSVLLCLSTFLLHDKTVTVILTMLYAFVALGTKSLSLAMIPEQKFPMAVMGTVIGVVSFIGYSPDAFFYPVMGRFFTIWKTTGYRWMFGLYLCVALVGVVCCRLTQAPPMTKYGE
ncbi:MAG: MFS transporter [Lachnospiraceae bacterium]|nr:MFS transporter [Lachnospiraceae bacterium]